MDIFTCLATEYPLSWTPGFLFFGMPAFSHQHGVLRLWAMGSMSSISALANLQLVVIGKIQLWGKQPF